MNLTQYLLKLAHKHVLQLNILEVRGLYPVRPLRSPYLIVILVIASVNMIIIKIVDLKMIDDIQAQLCEVFFLIKTNAKILI